MTKHTDGLKQAAKEKSNACFSRSMSAIDRLQKQGKAVTFSAVIQEAKVSRAYLYSNQYLCQQIKKVRDNTLISRSDSPEAMIEVYRIEIRRLKAEVDRLKKNEEQCRMLQREVSELKEQLKTAYKY